MSALPSPGSTRPPLSLYSPGQDGLTLADCWFYHTVDLPGHDTIYGQWDLRAGVDDYLGRVDFRGKRVLEVGTASGMLCFAMEQRGANMVAFDLAPEADWDLVPHAGHPDLEAVLQFKKGELGRLRNSYWYSHRVLKSQAQVVYGSVYHMPAAIGPVDISTFGSILLHLRDPFLALANAARLTRETIVVTDIHRADSSWWRRFTQRFGLTRDKQATPALTFLPNASNPHQVDTWWALNPEVVKRFLGVLGFENARVTYHTQLYGNKPHQLFTVVAQRTRSAPQLTDAPFS